MGVSQQVNGPFTVQIDGNNSSSVFTGSTITYGSTPKFLGISRGPGHIHFDRYFTRVRTDNAGTDMPADMQRMGKDARIRLTLSAVDQAVLALIEQQGASAEGSPGLVGELMGISGKTFALRIASRFLPWNFYNCILMPRDNAEGTEYETIDLDFYAFCLIGSIVNPDAAIAAGVIKPLFDHNTIAFPTP